jgi:hypothetical protein
MPSDAVRGLGLAHAAHGYLPAVSKDLDLY